MTGPEYLQQHGIDAQSVSDFKLIYDENELHIPVRNEEGKVIFAKHRNLKYDKNNPESSKYRYDAGSKATLFNYDKVKERSYMVISEGEIDCVRLNQELIPSVSSTGGSQTFKPEWVELIADKTIFICYDNDKAGREGTEKLFKIFPEAKAVILPEKIKDVCEFFAAGNKREQFIALLKNAYSEAKWNERFRPEDYKRITATELSAMEFPPESWLIDRILYKEGFCFLYGAEGTGKSFLTLSIAQAIAMGTSWLDTFKVAESAKVMFIDKENPKSMLSKRLKNMGIDSPNITWVKYPEKLQLTDSKGDLTPFSIALAEDVEAEDIKLIVIDSFVDLMVGNENAAGETQKFFNAVRVMFPHQAILVLHHENKPSQGVYRNDSQRARGSSNINAQTVTQFRLEMAAKSKTDLTIKQTKARDAQKLDKFMVQMLVEPDGLDMTKVTGFRYMGVVEEGQEDAEKSKEAQTLIEDILADSVATSKKEIIKAGEGAGISERTLERTLKQMVSDEVLEKMQKGHEAYYTLMFSVKTENEEE